MEEVSIKDLPIFKKKFAVNFYNLPYDVKEKLKYGHAIAIKVIDVILVPCSVKGSVTSSTVTHSPKVYSGNIICGYTVRGGRSSTSRHSEEIETASSQTAYLSEMVAMQWSMEGAWREFSVDLKLPMIIITPDKLIREVMEEELNPKSKALKE